MSTPSLVLQPVRVALPGIASRLAAASLWCCRADARILPYLCRKSTLLSLLGGRSKARLVGDIFFNGQPQTKATKRSMGFVTQDDLLFAEVCHKVLHPRIVPCVATFHAIRGRAGKA